jgi:hypothetical protein
MTFDINQFLQLGLTYGGARPSKFDVQLTLPTAINFDNTFSRKLNFTCKAASIPAFQVGEIMIPYFGRKVKTAGDRVWNDWRITVMLDEDYITRIGFETWNNAINNIQTNVMQQNLDGSVGTTGEGYKCAWTVTQYSKDGTSIAQYTIENGWPKTIGQMVLDWNGTDRISEFEVEVAFDNFYPSTITGAKFSGLTGTNYISTLTDSTTTSTGGTITV